MLEAVMYLMPLFCHRFNASPLTCILHPLIIKIRPSARTAPNLQSFESALNCFLSCQVLFSKSNTKHVFRSSNMAWSFHDRARMYAIGRGIGVERRVQFFSIGLNTCAQSNNFRFLSNPPKM